MAGKRLLDAAKLFNVSRSVAKQHIVLRQQQWDVYSQTSSLARAVKAQTDRVTVTAGAAYELAKRFSESAPPSPSQENASYDRVYPPPKSAVNVPRRGTVAGDGQRSAKEGVEQDHHYQRSAANSTVETPPEGDLDVTQKKAERYSLPDGTIPTADLQGARDGRDTFNQRPDPESEKRPMQEDGFVPRESGRSSIPVPGQDNETVSSLRARELQRQSEAQIPSQASNGQSSTQGEDTFYARDESTSPGMSSLPRSKIPKHVEYLQGSDEHVTDKDIDQDVYYSAGGQAKPEGALEGINTGIFQSSQVARTLGGKGKPNRYFNREKIESSPATWPPRDRFVPHETTEAQPEGPAAPVESDAETQDLAASLAKDGETPVEPTAVEEAPEHAPYAMRESRVPSSRFGRLWQYGGLATSMAFGAVGESFRRVTGGESTGSVMLSEANMERLVVKLSRMRGAALKLGQMMSFQDSKMLPPTINAVLQRVQDSADYMPPSQRNQVLIQNLGHDWRDHFSHFEEKPFAAASIGQVHKATLAESGTKVAVKIQYPGVRNSIDSDLNNLSLLLTASRLLPKGLYLEKTIANARTELGWECDYEREAQACTRFKELLAEERDTFTVPTIHTSASGPGVLTADFMPGTAVTKIPDLTQADRDWVGTQILRLCLRELMEWRFMQTDPNWTNFLYNRQSQKLELLDFGASREFPREFIEPYVSLLIAASKEDRDACRELSIQLGYLTGHESSAMLTAHVDSILTLAEPFMGTSPDVYDFKDQTITDRVREKIGLMVRERLAPPPEETYSLHRKLSGAFLLCARLGSRIKTKEMFVKAVKVWDGKEKKVARVA